MNSALKFPATTINQALPGIDEQSWDWVLGGATTLALPQAEILVVAPRPDDETFGAGGLIRSAAIRAHEVSVLSVTDGEAAYPNWRALRKVRRAELRRSLMMLSPHPFKVRRLKLPDGQVSQYREAIFAALDRMASKTTLLVAPYELDGHPDHVATSEACAEFAYSRELTLWKYPIWAWHHEAPSAMADLRWGKFPLSHDTQCAKALAIQCFASQLRPVGRAPIIPPHMLPYFTRPFEAFLL